MKKINIIYEGEGFLVVDKPAGLLVYLPDGYKEEETVVSILKDKLSYERVGQRTGIVHRLDRDTSGVLLVAKNEKSEAEFKKIFKDRKIEKKYISLVWGIVELGEGEINIPLGRGSKDRLRVVPKEGGKNSITKYKVLKHYPKSNMTLLDIDLLTGRTHQIRVHFSAIGHPVVGDKKYSNKKTTLKRQFLHANSISFINPETSSPITIKSELPNDLSEFIKGLS